MERDEGARSQQPEDPQESRLGGWASAQIEEILVFTRDDLFPCGGVFENLGVGG
jgi:hypothetical protein